MTKAILFLIATIVYFTVSFNSIDIVHDYKTTVENHYATIDSIN